MAHCRRLRNPMDERRQTRSNTSSKRCLRKRRPSLRYIDDDSQSESAELSPRLFSCAMESQNNTSFTFGSLQGKALDDRVKADKTHSDTLGHGFSHSVSGRASVVSCDSYDSGVSSRSDDEPGCLPSTPEKITPPIKIAVVSPSSRGVIELVDNGSDGFIGYFKPDAVVHSPSLSTEDQTHKPCGCSPSLLRRSRITRSISTNLSDDSCDSAFQHHRSPPVSKHDRAGNITMPSSSANDEIKTTVISSKSNNKLGTVDNKSTKFLTRKPIRKRNESPLKRSAQEPIKRRRRVLSPHNSPKRPRPAAKSKSLSPPAKPSRFAGKSALRRIQHHNRSPERSADVALVPPSAKVHCRTRSHVKSLLKNISNTPGPIRTSPMQMAKLGRSPHHLRKNNSTFQTSNTNLLTNQLRSYVPTSVFGRSPRFALSLKGGRCGIATEQEVQSGEEDTALDCQPDRSSKTACQWRFCKGEVSPTELADHIERLHVASQRRNSKVYRCFWEGCKVYGQVAKSIVWLEGHVRKHLGPRPYHCIFPDCTARFSSQELLQRHVDTHIDDAEQRRATKKVDMLEAKKADKKNIKRLRGTEKCIPKRTDFFTSNILEAIYWENKMLQEKWSHLLTVDRSAFKLQGQIVAMATDDLGKPTRVQLHWLPERLRVPDSWHEWNDPVVFTRTKPVKISSLPRELLIDLCMH